MELDNILKKLYSQNQNEILNVINTAMHADCEDYPRDARCIHTGFRCKTQTGKILAFIYCIDNKQLYFQRNNSIPLLGVYMRPNQSAVFFRNWLIVQKKNPLNECPFPYYHCIEYDQDNNNVKIEEITCMRELVESHYTIYDVNGTQCNEFHLIKNNKIIQYKIDIYNPIMSFYYGNNKFRL